ncbi:MAG: M28 family peptidase [Deltaproteobacteria bacterium]|nr:M28 family peptidase [Deltaproteobacteria bacterium]
MIRIRLGTWTAALGVGALLAAGPGFAADVLIPAKVGLIKPGKLVKLVSKPSAAALPAPGSGEDPTLHGAQLTVLDTGTANAGMTFTLAASGWSGLGNPAGSKGYKYKGKNDPGSACSAVLIKPTVIKAVCKGVAVSIAPPFAGDMGVVLGLPAGSTAALRYCAQLGGTTSKNDASLLKRKDAAAPASCPESLAIFDANDLLALTDDALLGRNNNTAGSATAQQIIIDTLEALGAVGLDDTQSGEAAFKQPFVQSGSTGTNILGVFEGSTLANEYVIVGAHYDHLGSCRDLQPGDTVCNGATDNAAGVAAALGIARGIAALPTRPARSVVIALWDAEEDGLRGSLYYTDHPLVPIASTKAYVNFDIQGANLLPSLRNFTFAVGAETGNGLGALVAAAAAGNDLDERQLSYLFGQGRSDYVNFVAKSVPTIFFSDSTGPCYHSDADEPEVVDFGKLAKQTQRGYALTLALANTMTPPTFAGTSPALAAFSDAVVLDEVLTAGVADLGLFTPTDQTALMNAQSVIHIMVTDGEVNFDGTDVTNLLLATLDVIDILTRTTCDGFLAP